MPDFEHDGLTLHYATRGDPDTPPVVLVHDAGADGRAWHPLVVALAPDFYAITPDLRGHGRSAAPFEAEDEAAAPTIEDYVAELAALLDHLGLELAAVVGHGFGGIVALHFAVQHPERVAGIVLSDTTPAHDHPQYEDAIRAHEAQIAGRARAAGSYGAPLLGKRASLALNDPFLARGLRSLYACLDPDALAATVQARASRPDVLPLLHERLATVPVLLAYGERGPFAEPAGIMARELTAARLVAFRDEPLDIPLTLPDAFARQVLAFFDLLERGEPIAAHLRV